MSKFIAQKEEVCSGCYREIQKGEWVYENCWEDIFCLDCEEEDLEEIDSDNTNGFYRH